MANWLSRTMVSFLNSGLGPEADAEFLRRVRTLNLTGLALITFGGIYLVAAAFLQSWNLDSSRSSPRRLMSSGYPKHVPRS